MKIFKLLLIFILLLTKLTLHAQQPDVISDAQQAKTITLSVKNATFEQVLAQIKKQMGISFFYNKEVLKLVGKISFQVDKKDLKTVLNLCLKNTPVSYSIVGKIVVISHKNTKKSDDGSVEMDVNESYIDFFSQNSISGYVYGVNGEKLNSASVVIKRNRQGTTTKANGSFVLENVRTNDTLHISFIGYNFKDVPVSFQKEFNIQLTESKNELDLVEVQAYGTTTKRLSIGEINQVNAKDIERQPVTNPLLAIKGMVPGALLTPTSGYGNGPVKVEIRGRKSIDPTSISDPLYIIDGVPLIQSNIGIVQSSYENGSTGLQQAGFSLSGGQSPFANINPNDIESITVLKDAAATAMYGSRAGNGVIIINTKKGKAGKNQFDISAGQTIKMAIGHHEMLNTSQYLQMRREALRNDGLVPSVANAPDIALWDTTRYVDWQRELWKSARSSFVQASLSGGSELSTFRISGSYNADKDVSPLANLNTIQAARIAFSFNHRSYDQKLSIDLSAIYGANGANQISYAASPALAPNLPPIFDGLGNLNYADWNAAGLGDSFPFKGLKNPSKSNTDLLNGSLRVAYQIANGLKAGLTMGYNLGLFKNSYLTTIASQNPLTNPSGTAIFGNSRTDGWNITPQIDYNRHIGKGKLTAILGANLNNTVADGLTILASGFTSDELLRSVNNAMFPSNFQNSSQSKYIDFHGSLNYNWADKYIVEISGNRDGSSNFGPGRQFGSFGVAGLAWIASEENWLRKALPSWISLIKLKGSYGTTGSYPNIAYQYLSQWASSSYAGTAPLYSYNGVVPQVPIHAVNQDYRWEINQELNSAIDLGFFEDRFSLHAAVYRKHSNNQLALLPTPLFTGFASVQGNSQASVENTGLEIALNARLMDEENFSWQATLNYSHNRNKLRAFPGIAYTGYYSTQKIGESLNNVYLYHYKGVDPQTGQRSYQDYDNNGFIRQGFGSPGTAGDDRFISINTAPKFESSVINRFSYKSLSLDVQLYYRSIIARVPYIYTGGTLNNIPLDVFNNHWQKPGDVSPNPRFSTISGQSDGLFAASDGAYTNASYLRLQNVALRYALPDQLTKRIGMQNISLLISMQNVFTLSRYPGIDPELTFGSQPQPKIFSGQLSLTF